MGWRDRDYARTAGEFHLRARVVVSLIVVTVITYLIQGALLGRGEVNLSQILGVVPRKMVESGWLWQLVTHPFLHDPGAISHLLYNMLFLYFLGTDVAEIYGPRKFLGLYFGGAALCAITYCVAGYAIGQTQVPAIGASGAIMAVSVVAAFYFPTRIILFMMFLPLPLWMLVGGYVAIDLYYPLAGLRPWTQSAGHLGGALFGLIWWIVTTRRGFNLKLGLRMPKMALSSKPSRDEVDRILDKINAQGIGSLTPAERKTLERAAD